MAEAMWSVRKPNFCGCQCSKINIASASKQETLNTHHRYEAFINLKYQSKIGKINIIKISAIVSHILSKVYNFRIYQLLIIARFHCYAKTSVAGVEDNFFVVE